MPNHIDLDILEMGKERYRDASGLNDMERDNDGFIVLKPTASHTDQKKAALTADISSLEAKLQKYKEEKQKVTAYQKTEDYRDSKKTQSKKKMKKKKENLLNMVFNNADHMFDDQTDEDDIDDDDEENEGYKDSRKSKAKARKANMTTLDTTYGKRFAPVVSMLQDTIFEFDKIAADIEADLNSSRNNAKTMYRSSQIGNMISAKNSKLSAVKELGSIAKVISDLEYKKEKDKKDAEGSDSSKAVANMAARILRGGIDDIDTGSGKKGKKGKKDKDGGGKKSLTMVRGISRNMLDDDDDDDSPYGKIERQKKSSMSDADQKVLAGEFAKTLMENKDKIKLTPWERNVQLEGTYNVQVLCDPLDPTGDWKFVAVSTKNGKILNGDEYKEILPKKKKTRMRFDLNKARATDANSNRTYKLMFK